MKENLKKEVIDRLPATEEEFLELMAEKIATPEGAAAMFVLALAITAENRDTGFACFCDVCASPPDRDTFDAVIPDGNELHEIAFSYLHKNAPQSEEWPQTVTIKLTDEKPLKRHFKTVYVGCSGTGSYRPLTLVSKPPRYLKKRFGIKRDYYEDPRFVAEYPSMVLPVALR